MRAVLADTGPLYAAFDPGDQYHPRAKAEMDILNQRGISVQLAYSTLSEAYSLVLYRFSSREALHFLTQLHQSVFLLSVSSEDYEQASDVLKQFADQRLSLFDAVLYRLSQRVRLPVWTYDHHFDVMQAQVWRPGI